MGTIIISFQWYPNSARMEEGLNQRRHLKTKHQLRCGREGDNLAGRYI
jgi:hypothetical protein